MAGRAATEERLAAVFGTGSVAERVVNRAVSPIYPRGSGSVFGLYS